MLFSLLLLILILVHLLEISTFFVSIGKHSFYEWSKAVQINSASFISCDYQSLGPIGKAPVIILCNHVPWGYRSFGSYLSVAHIVRRPCKIICYEKYGKKGTYPTDTILKNEIRITRSWSKAEKEYKMYTGIADTLSSGQDVIMFIDAHLKSTEEKHKTPIRTLNKLVLEKFPEVYKVVCNIENLSNDNLKITQHKPTIDMESTINNVLAGLDN